MSVKRVCNACGATTDVDRPWQLVDGWLEVADPVGGDFDVCSWKCLATMVAEQFAAELSA